MQMKVKQLFKDCFSPEGLPKISFVELESIAYISKSPIQISKQNTAILHDIMNKVTSAYEQRLKAVYSSVPRDYIRLVQDIDTLCSNTDKLDKSIKTLQSLDLDKIDKGKESVNYILEQMEKEELDSYNKKLQSYRNEMQSIIEDIVEGKEKRRVRLAEERTNKILAIHEGLSPLLEKLQDIIVAFEDIDYLEPIYNVKRTNLAVDTELVDIKEFKLLVETAHYTLGIISNKTPLSFLSSILYLPAVHKFKDPALVGSIYLAIMYLFLFVVRPYGVAVLAVFFLINLFVNVFKVYDNKRVMQLAYVLARDKDAILTRLDEIILRHPDIMSITKAMREIDFEDTDAEIATAVTSIEQTIRDFENTNPTPRLTEIRDYILSRESMSIIESALRTVVERESHTLKKQIDTLSSNYREHYSAIREHSNALVKFGEMTSDSPVIGTTFKMGIKYYHTFPIEYLTYSYPFKNTLFRYDTEEERDALLEQIKLMYINTFTQVHPTSLVTTIFDPLKRGSDFSELFDQQLEHQLNLFDKPIGDLVKTYQDIAKNNMFITGSKSVDQYNEDSRGIGRVPLEYNLVILLSNEGNLAENKEFISFMEYSTINGVWFWVLDNVKYTKKQDVVEVDETKLYDLPITITKPGNLKIDGVTQTWEMPKFEKLTYEWELANFAKKNYIQAVEDSKITIIDFETQLRQTIVPDDKIWTFDTLNGIDMYFGFIDGDLTKPYKETLGDRTVHALMAGATGAGKSVMINQALSSMLHMYSPEWLQLVMIDFKNIEFAMYTGDYLIPHASIISGTKDGEYAVSVFDWLLTEMKRRQNVFADNRVQNIRGYNRRVLAKEITGDIMPRILVLFDEFQAMFVAVDDTKLDTIRKSIAALSREARAMGVHLWFTSQSMTGTIPDDVMNQFGLRACLRVDSKEASTSIIGNDAAANLPRLGYAIVTADPMKPQYNRLCKIPLITDQYINEYLTKIIYRTLNDKDAQGNKIPHVHRNASFYNEDELHDADEIIAWYDTPGINLKDDASLFLMGEQMSFSDNALPVNIKLNREDGQNISFCGYKREDACNFLATILDNLRCHNEKCLIAATIADEEISLLIGLDDYLTEGSRARAGKDKVKDLLGTLFVLLESREAEKEEDFPPLYYFVIGVDKFGEGRDYTTWEAMFPELLRRGPAVGIHTIAYSRTPKSLRLFQQGSNYLCCTPTTEINAVTFMDKMTAARIPDSTCVMRTGTEEVKFKLYQHVFDESKIKETTRFVSRGQLKE